MQDSEIPFIQTRLGRVFGNGDFVVRLHWKHALGAEVIVQDRVIGMVRRAQDAPHYVLEVPILREDLEGSAALEDLAPSVKRVAARP